LDYSLGTEVLGSPVMPHMVLVSPLRTAKGL